jgi:hypothetical protein
MARALASGWTQPRQHIQHPTRCAGLRRRGTPHSESRFARLARCGQGDVGRVRHRDVGATPWGDARPEDATALREPLRPPPASLPRLDPAARDHSREGGGLAGGEAAIGRRAGCSPARAGPARLDAWARRPRAAHHHESGSASAQGTVASARGGSSVAPATIEVMRAGLGVRDATLISVMAYAGLRPGEALGLRWSDVRERTLLIQRSISLG